MFAMKEVFLERIAEVLEVPAIGWTDEFRSVPMWSSLTGFALVVLLEQQYGKHVTPADLQPLRTVADLAALVGIAS